MSTSNYTIQIDDALCEEWQQEKGEQLEYLAQKNAGTDSKHLRKLPVKKYTVFVFVCVCFRVTTHLL